jgi:pyruvate, water dikinase
VSRIAFLEDGADAAGLGGKGAGLARLVALGLPVPPAFVITVDAYDDDSVRDEVAAAYERIGGGPVAVRSSAAGEDSAERSFAGGHDTYLWVVGAEELWARVRDCWRSLYSERAVAYREREPGGPAPAMAVCVQEMVDARSAGVFMTLDPANGDRSVVVIEAVWGLGEPLVSGQVTPDRFVVDKITGDVARVDPAVHERELARDPSGRGTAERPVPAERRERRSLERPEVDELVRVARRVEEAFGAPQDGEFAVTAGGEVLLLQCRPETVWSRRPRKSVAGGRNALQSVVSTLKGEGR